MKKLIVCSSTIKFLPEQIIKNVDGYAYPVTADDLTLDESEMFRVVDYADSASIYVKPVAEEDNPWTSNDSWDIETSPPVVAGRITQDPDALRGVGNELRRKRQVLAHKKFSALIRGDTVIEGDRVRITDSVGRNGIMTAVKDDLGDHEVVEVLVHMNIPVVAILVKIQKWDEAQRGGQYITAGQAEEEEDEDDDWKEAFRNIKFVLAEDEDV
jgi:hypothetical protein